MFGSMGGGGGLDSDEVSIGFLALLATLGDRKVSFYKQISLE